MRAYLNTAEKAAFEAGKLIMSYQNRLSKIAIEKKSMQNYVSGVDYMSEKTIIDLIHSRYPEHKIITEESGFLEFQDSDTSDLCWIIDPLDGTSNFLHNHLCFSVSIALMKENEIILGVVYDPVHNEMFSASIDMPATLDKKRIYPSKTSKMDESLIATGFPFKNQKYQEKQFKQLKKIIDTSGDIRRCGSAALDLCWVACGRLDGYWEYGLNKWDMAAGAFIIKQAKGVVQNLSPAQDWFESGNVIASNFNLAQEFSKILGAK